MFRRRTIRDYRIAIACLEKTNLPLDFRELGQIPGQSELDAAFDSALAVVDELSTAEKVDDVLLPDWIPVPRPGARSGGDERATAFDLACIAGADVFLHEVRHVLFALQAGVRLAPLEEEIECDRFSRSMLMDNASIYASQCDEPPDSVAAKRAMGLLVAKLAILAITPAAQRHGSVTHPPVQDRLREALQAAGAAPPSWFWLGAAAALAAFARWIASKEGRPLSPVSFSDRKYLAFALLELV